MKGIVSILIIFIISLAITEPLQASNNDLYQYDDYERIYKENGIWYGIIEITESHLLPEICMSGHCEGNLIYIAFSRDTEMLTSITYDYTTQKQCDGFSLFGFCLGSTTPSYTGTEEIYHEDDHGFFSEYILGDNPITKTINFFGNRRYDYRITSENKDLFDSVDIIEFTYILEEHEIDDVMAIRQQQYNDDIDIILTNDTMNIEEKELAAEKLKTEYESFTIDYGEEIRSLCLNHDQCHIENESTTEPKPIAPILGDTKDTLISIGLMMVVIVIIYALFHEATSQVTSIITTIFSNIFNGLGNLIWIYLLEPLINGTKFITTKLFSLIFWWL